MLSLQIKGRTVGFWDLFQLVKKTGAGVIGLISVAAEAQGRGFGRGLLEMPPILGCLIEVFPMPRWLHNETTSRPSDCTSSRIPLYADIEAVYHFWLGNDE